MDNLLKDLRYGSRMLQKNLSMTIVIIMSLAIGIGANSAIFSIVDALLLRPLPYPQPDRLVAIWLHSPGIGILRDWPSPGQFVDLTNENHSFDQIAIAHSTTQTLTGIEKAQRVNVLRTSSNLFRILGATPKLGRLLQPEEDKPGAAPVALLSAGLWQRRFSANPKIVGTSVTLDGKQFTIAGVLSPEFRLDSEVMPSEGPMDKIEIFEPLPLDAKAAQNRGDENYNLVARLKPGTSVQQAQADVSAIANRIRIKDKRDRTFGMTVIGLQDQIVGDVRLALLVLLGSVALVLLIACANVANLLLTRSSGRQKEMAIRLAVGADSARIVRQLLTESLLLALLGGAVGLIIARLSLAVVRVMNPGNIPRLEDIGISNTVLVFTFGLSVVTGILFGIAPAWRSRHVDVHSALKSGGRSGETDSGFRFARNRFRGLLIVGELALCVTLLAGAGLLIRSFVHLQNVPPGYSTDHIMTMTVGVSGPKYRDNQNTLHFFQEALARVTQLPGVRSAGLVSSLPLTGTVGWGQVNVEGFTPPPGQELQVEFRLASGGYFQTLDIPLVAGRFFSEDDKRGGQLVAIVDQRFAKRFWPNESAIGKHLWFDDPKKFFTIAGVVKAVKQYALNDEGKIAMYLPFSQQPDTEMYLAIRTSSDPALIARPVADALLRLDPTVVINEMETMQDRLYRSLARQRFATTMLFAFALFALLLGAVGVYGVLSYLVSQNRQEIGMRIALGATPADVISLIVCYGMSLTLAGTVIGLFAALSLTRVMSSLLFGVTPTDPLTFAIVLLTLGSVAFAATALPAWRATRVDPMVALREE